MAFWTQQQIEELKRMWPTHSSEEIAVHFGYTHKQVRGKASRLGLRRYKKRLIEDAPLLAAPWDKAHRTPGWPGPIEAAKRYWLGGIAYCDQVPLTPFADENWKRGYLDTHECLQLRGYQPFLALPGWKIQRIG